MARQQHIVTETDEDIARYSVLHDNNRLFLSKYLTYLPTKEQLKQKKAVPGDIVMAVTSENIGKVSYRKLRKCNISLRWMKPIRSSAALA